MKTLINNMDSILNYIELTQDIDDTIIPKPEITYYDEFDDNEILEHEKELFGFYLTSHKTEKYKLNYPNITDLNNIKDNFGKNIDVIVNVDNIKEVITKNNEAMAFIKSSDNTGSISITLFPKIYKEIKVSKNSIIKVMGKVEKRFNEYQLIANKIEIL